MTPYPDYLRPVFERYITAAYTSLTEDEAAIGMPLTPYFGSGGTLDVSTGITYPTKAERARRNPKIALLYCDPKGSGVLQPLTILAQGYAAVRDSDLQANTDRYIRESMQKIPAAMAGMPKFLLRQMGWYFTRIYIEMTPAHLYWWIHGREDEPPEEWHAPEDLIYPSSDRAPEGKAPGAWKPAPMNWKADAARALNLGMPVLAAKGMDGFPMAMCARSVELTETGFLLEMPIGFPFRFAGEGSLSFSYHPETFTGQKNKLFRGRIGDLSGKVHFVVERQLGDWSAGGDNRIAGALSFLRASLQLRPRLKAEAARRGQPVPEVKL